MSKKRRWSRGARSAPPLNPLRCAWCPAPLTTPDGQPRYDLFTINAALVAVCYGGCYPSRAQQPFSHARHGSPMDLRATITLDAVLAGAGRG